METITPESNNIIQFGNQNLWLEMKAQFNNTCQFIARMQRINRIALSLKTNQILKNVPLMLGIKFYSDLFMCHRLNSADILHWRFHA